MNKNEIYVIKRNGNAEPFDSKKVADAVSKAMKDSSGIDEQAIFVVVSRVISEVEDKNSKYIGVDGIHVEVENSLMDARQYDVARAYISHRNEKRPDIFRPRANYKPFEYPKIAEFGTAIHASFWVHTEYDYTPDVQDIRIHMSEAEALTTKRCMLSISQVEVSVKEFWTKIGDVMPKPEIQEVGAIFGDSEVRHTKAYSNGIEKLGVNQEFLNLLQEPAFKKRLAYMKKSMSGAKSDDKAEYVKTLLFFTMFIENVSLFSQFFVLSQMNKEKGYLSGLSNAIAATALEENVHFLFGAHIINILRQERPEFFTEELEKEVEAMVHEAYEAEVELLGWIFEKGDFDYLHLSDVFEYMKKRFNRGLEECGFKPVFSPLESSIERTAWFDLQIDSSMHTDFLARRNTNYTVKQKSYEVSDMFDD